MIDVLEMETKPVRILVADDHQVMRDGIAATLAGVPDVEVVGESACPEDVFRLADRLCPDLILMDVRIRGADGIELAGQLLERHPSLSILMFSAYNSLELVHRSIQAGAKGYIVKDAPIEDLLRGIRVVASGTNYFSEAIRGRHRRSQDVRPRVSYRESQVLSQLAQGRSSKDVSNRLGVSLRTVETHRRNIMRKLNLVNRAELVRFAVDSCRMPAALLSDGN